MTDRVVYIHIGSHKTGSSAFQEMLFANHKTGTWCYPMTGHWHDDRSHNQIGIYFWEDFRSDLKTTAFEDVLSTLLNEIKGHFHVILSSELLEKAAYRGNRNRVITFVEALRALHFHIELIYCIRRQDFLVDSIFKQWVSTFETRYSGDPAAMATNEIPGLYYSTYISSWLSIPGVSAITVVPYLEGDFPGNTRRLCAAARITLPSFAPVPQANASLEAEFLALKHKINPHLETIELNDRVLNELFILQSKSYPLIKTTIFTPEMRMAFANNFFNENLSLSKYFPDFGERWIFQGISQLNLLQSIDTHLICATLETLNMHFEQTKQLPVDE